MFKRLVYFLKRLWFGKHYKRELALENIPPLIYAGMIIQGTLKSMGFVPSIPWYVKIWRKIIYWLKKIWFGECPKCHVLLVEQHNWGFSYCPKCNFRSYDWW